MKFFRKTRIWGAVVAALAVCCVSGAIGISALLTNSSTGDNIISINGNTVAVTGMPDMTAAPQAGEAKTYAGCPVVENAADSCTCFVRARLVYSSDGLKAKSAISGTGSEWSAVQPDGYMYYTKPLESGASTTPLFTEFSVNNTVTQDDLMSFGLNVYVESLQQGDYGTDYKKAWEDFL